MADPFVPPIVAKAFAALGRQAYAQLQRRRLEEARRIIAKRLAAGKYWAIKDDDAADAIFTYLRAAQEGAARRNLELIAEVLVNGAAEASFDPNEFRRHARQLADLSREEAIALAVMLKAPDLATEKSPWNPLVEYAVATGRFDDSRHLSEVCAGLLRTGYVHPLSLFGIMGFGPTREAERLHRLVDIEAVIREAEAEGVEA